MNKDLNRPILKTIIALVLIVLVKFVALLTLQNVDMAHPVIDIILSIGVVAVLLRFRKDFNHELGISYPNFPAAQPFVSGIVLLLVIITLYASFSPYSHILPYGLYHIIFFILMLIPVYSLWNILYKNTDRLIELFGVILSEEKNTCSCGWKNPLSARFCGRCGSPLQERTP